MCSANGASSNFCGCDVCLPRFSHFLPSTLPQFAFPLFAHLFSPPPFTVSSFFLMGSLLPFPSSLPLPLVSPRASLAASHPRSCPVIPQSPLNAPCQAKYNKYKSKETHSNMIRRRKQIGMKVRFL